MAGVTFRERLHSMTLPVRTRSAALLTLLAAAPALIAPAVFAPAALANDSAASLAAGGLVVLEQTDRVAMAAERLTISPDGIDILYHFVSTTGQPETLHVAFPLPQVTLASSLHGAWTVESSDPVNFVDFRLTIDGRPVVPAVQQRAYAPDGRDVTDLLTELDLPLVSFVDPPGEDSLWERLEGADSSGLRKQLTQAGLVDEWGGADWSTDTLFHWEMTVPADQPLIVEHQYVPVFGLFQFYEEYSDWRQELAPWCVTEHEMHGIRRVSGESSAAGMTGAIVQVIDYILTTGANWAGPIGDFHLILDKGSPDAIISLCWEGELTRTSPTTFEFRATDWTPTRDLSVAIFRNLFH